MCSACRQRHAEPSRKIFYINSYHQGYPASDEVMKEMKVVLDSAKVELTSFFLDTKNDTDTNHAKAKALAVWEEIEKSQPDAIIVSDDAAVKYLVVPFLKNKEIPVVFCGVNWSAAVYGLPVVNVTGMLEVLPLRKNLETMLSYYPQAKKLTVLSERSLSEEKNREILDTLYRRLGFSVTYEMVGSFADWQDKFIGAVETADIIYLPTNGAIKGWDTAAAKTFVEEHITKPVITCDDFMMPYCVYGLTKVAGEQGRWAAETALDIMKGKSPGDIPVTENKESRSFINKKLASKAGFKPTQELLQRSQIIN